MSTDIAITSTETISSSKIMSTTTLAGTAIGFLSFLATGLVPALYFGGFVGLILASGIFGTPVPQTILSQGLVVFSMLLGLLAVGSMYIISGAFLGSMLGWLGLYVSGKELDVHAEE